MQTNTIRPPLTVEAKNKNEWIKTSSRPFAIAILRIKERIRRQEKDEVDDVKIKINDIHSVGQRCVLGWTAKENNYIFLSKL